MIRRVRGDGDGDAVRHDHTRAVAHVAGLVVEDFVAGVDERAQGEVNGLAHAHRHDDLRGRIVGDVEVLGDVTRDALAEARQAEITRVAGVPALQRINGGLADAPRGVKIGLADAERDDVLHGLDDLEKVANPRARNVADVVGDE